MHMSYFCRPSIFMVMLNINSKFKIHRIGQSLIHPSNNLSAQNLYGFNEMTMEFFFLGFLFIKILRTAISVKLLLFICMID